MSSLVELEIRSLLITEESSEHAAREMLERIQDPYYDWDDRIQIIAFALNAGLHNDCAIVFSKWTLTEEKLPWGQLINLFAQFNISPTPEVIEALVWGAHELDQFEELGDSHGWDDFDKIFSELRKSQRKYLQACLKEKANRVIDRLNFARQHRIIDEERLAMSELRESFPHFAQEFEKSDFNERWAREVLDRARPDSLKETKPSQDSDFANYCRFLYNEAIKLEGLEGQKAYDLAIMFTQMELPEFAKGLLDHCDLHPQKDWLELDLLVRAERLIEALATTDKIEALYPNDPETTFATTYYRSKILWSLGQREQAISLLQSLVKIRADYRSAHSLLHSWVSEAT